MCSGTKYPVSIALAVALLTACPSGGERPRPGAPDSTQPTGALGAFGDSAMPDTTPPEEPQPESDEPPREAGGGEAPPDAHSEPAGVRPGVAGTTDTAPAPGVPSRPGTSDTELVAPVGPGVMDTAVSGPVVGPRTIWRPPVGALDTAAAVAPNRRAGRLHAAPGVHR
jgi:hypothetical protein